MKPYERVSIQIQLLKEDDVVRTSGGLGDGTSYTMMDGDNEIPYEGGWND